MNSLSPGLLMIVGAPLLAILRGRFRCVAMVALPCLSWVHMTWGLAPEPVHTVMFDLELTPIRADALSLVWGHVFHLAALLAAIYSLNWKDALQPVMAIAYAGASIASVFAGDVVSLFTFWELTAVTSVFLIWAGKTPRAFGAGMRYLLLQVGSGVLLLFGVLLKVQQADISFGLPGEIGLWTNQVNSLPNTLIFIAFGIKAAFPLLHTWLPDAYPEATPGGTVFLSSFTTKLAVYALVRGFAGYESLIWIGVVMAIVPLLYAIAVDDLRRSLAYCLNNQLGFMVVAAGVGSELAINGAAAHAVAHILYKGLLFMAVGAVLYRAGTAKASDLGGLGARMPITLVCYLFGVAGIAMPLFCGFVTKSLSISAVAEAHHAVAWLALEIGTAGVFMVCGLRIPYEIFFKPTPANQVARIEQIQEAPANMGLAMMLSALCCLLIGLLPGVVYRQLPFAVDYHAYTFAHVVAQLQLVAFAGLAFVLLHRLGVLGPARAGVLLDFDWVWRTPCLAGLRLGRDIAMKAGEWNRRTVNSLLEQLGKLLKNAFAEEGTRGRFASTGRMAMFAALMLVVYLLLYYR